MRITKRTSYRLAIFVLVSFFVISLIIANFGGKSTKRNTDSSTIKNNIDSEKANPTTDTSSQTDSATKLHEFHRSEMRNGKKIWEVIGSIANYQEKTDTPNVVLENARFSYFNQNEEPSYAISSKDALLKLSLTGIDKVELKKSVVMELAEDSKITSEEAYYDMDTEMVSIPVELKITSKLSSIEGTSLVGNVKSQQFLINGPIKSVLINNKKGN